MSVEVDKLRDKICREISFYVAQNDNLRKEISHLEQTFSNNKARYDTISSDYEESQEMLRIMKLITR